MRAAADDGFSSSDVEASRQLEEQELFEGACQESFLAAGSTGSSSSCAPALLPVQEVVAAAQPVGATAAAAAPPSTTATTLARLTIAAPCGRWGGCCSVWVCVCGGVGGGRCVDRQWLNRHRYRHTGLVISQGLPGNPQARACGTTGEAVPIGSLHRGYGSDWDGDVDAGANGGDPGTI
jgi:hypothetical protein